MIWKIQEKKVRLCVELGRELLGFRVEVRVSVDSWGQCRGRANIGFRKDVSHHFLRHWDLGGPCHANVVIEWKFG